jgi:molybdopterin converting factor small subunit
LIREKANGKLDGVSLRIALNRNYVPDEFELQEGDEVVFIPPVQGG